LRPAVVYDAAMNRGARVWLLMVPWALLVIDLLLLAPSARPSSLDLFVRAAMFNLSTFDPALIALFYATGIVVTLHASLVWAEPHESRPHPLALLLVGYALGSVFFLPYYAFRRRALPRARSPWPASPILRWILVFELVCAAGYGIAAGSVAELWAEITERWFSHYLALDFVILVVLLIALRAGKLAPRDQAAAAPAAAA
jgi:hypothetical protein